MIDEIISETIQSEEDILIKDWCTCSHTLSEHTLGKCYGLDFNGTVWIACNCTNIVSVLFEIKFHVEIEESRTAA